MTLNNLMKYSKEIEKICKKEKRKKLAVFGSTLRGDATTESDIDFLVEFDGTQTLFQVIHLKQEFEKKLKTCVDVVTKESLSKYFRDEVLKEAKVIYEASKESSI